MFCPRCSRPAATEFEPVCAGCGLRLDPVARLLAREAGLNDLQALAEGEHSPRLWYRRWDVRLMFFSIVILPLIFLLAYRFDSPLPFTIPSFIFLVGLSSTAYSAIFGEDPTQLSGRPAARLSSPANSAAYLEVLMARLNTELAQQDALSPMVIEGLMLELIAATSRSFTPAVDREHPVWLAKVDGLLQTNFAAPLTLTDIAARSGVHPTHLARAFRQHYGCTVGERIRQLRVEESCQLLLSTETPLSEIALAAGFYDQSHFSRCFRQLRGVTPSEFRAANQTR
jgi:AraC-like DNA-binding protein